MQIEYDFTVEDNPTYNFTAESDPEYDFTPSNSINITGTSDYNDLENKPSINGNTLEGNKTLEELGAFSGDYNDLANKPNLFSGDYDDLTDKPSINGHPLEGDKTAEELGLMATDLGEIDEEQYDWDDEALTGSYIFLWDEF